MSEYKQGRKWDQERLSRLVIIWQKARTIDEVCKRMGAMYSEVAAQASLLRGKGVPMKRFKRRPLDYDALRALAIKHAVPEAP